MRMSLIITIVVVGLLGTGVAALAGALYYRLALASERDNLQEQLSDRVAHLRRALEEAARELGLNLAAVGTPRDGAMPLTKLARSLDGLLRHPVARGEGIAIHRLLLLDRDLGLLASTPRALVTDTDAALCAGERERVQHQRGKERRPVVFGICLASGQAYYSVIAPVGLPEPYAYLQLIADFAAGAQALEESLGAPLALSLSDGTALYRSRHWTPAQSLVHSVRAEYELATSPDAPAPLRLSAVRDVAAVQERFNQTQNLVLLAAIAAIFLTALLALAVLQRTSIYPLERLSAQLRRIREDRHYLGQPVDVRGNAEVAELAEGFNAMTAQLKELYQSLERMAFTDSLTTLPNRALFQDRLQQLILAAQREQRAFALLIMDLDHFKEVNDTLGHPVGDRLLQEVADRLRAKLRESDTVARLGGDEFAVLLPTVTQPHAAMAARMLLQALRTPVIVDGHSLEVGASIGIALFPEHGRDAHVLLQRADIAMYAAKQANTGYAFYESRFDHHDPTRLALLGELRRAIEHEQFVLYYQPLINLWTNRVNGAEALLRWRHAREGLLPPERFIPLLEQTGLIRSLTPWVVNEALRTAAALRGREQAIAISINLSVRDLQDPDLTPTLLEALAAQQARPEWLTLEITESAVMTDPERAREVLLRLADMGFRLAIDDFGTGYSSLAYLKKLPVRVLKIDKSFVVDMVRDQDDAAIVRTSIELGHNLGLEVVAEGVESGEVLQRLSEARCDAAQGLHVSPPLAADELQQWLRDSAWAATESSPHRRNG
jgi:diguanylate cyclase (GGDEF)-like protein